MSTASTQLNIHQPQCNYVERNALTADLVDRAEDYRWGSLWNWRGGDSVVK